jgi:ATP-binding cassette, subfamily B, bacterial
VSAAAGGRFATLRNVGPVLRIVWEAGPALMASNVALRVAAALVPLGVLSVARRIVDLIVQAAASSGPPPASLWRLVGLEFALASLGAVLGKAVIYASETLGEKYTAHVSIRVMSHASRLDLASYENPDFYDKMDRARVQATDRLVMVGAVARLLEQAVTAASLCVGVFAFSPLILLGFVACTAPAVFGEGRYAFLLYAMNYRHTPRRRELEYLRTLGASKESAKELRIFGLSDFFVGRYRSISEGLLAEGAALRRRAMCGRAALAVLSTVGYYGAYAYVVFEAARGRVSVGSLVFLAGAIAGAGLSIREAFAAAAAVVDQSLYVGDLRDFLAMAPTIRSPAGARAVPRPMRRGFEFCDVSFAYPGRDQPVLRGLTFKLAPGERLALVGENGQGKTTIVKLLLRLYDPTEGRVLLDGVDLRDYDVEDLRREVSVIFQDFVRYDMTASDNIATGRIALRGEAGLIEGAARKSLADPVIRRLPGGYGQMLGRRFDGGVDLSGGEWQKVALARAYLRDAQLLVLDEPTASLDARAETEAFQHFADLTDGKMALLISHRFSTVRMADRILVLRDGRVVEEGNHAKLMAARGLYAEMYELQAANYR